MSKEREYKIGDTITSYGNDDFWNSYLLKHGYVFNVIDTEDSHIKYEIVAVLEPVTEYEKIQMLHNIFEVIMQINGGAVVRSGLGHPTAFFEYSGHVNKVHIQIYKKGWVSKGDSEYESYDIDFDEPTLYTAKKVYNELIEIWGDILKEEVTESEVSE